MARVSRRVHVAALPDRVFALVSDPARIAGLDPRVGGVRVERGLTGPRRVHLEFSPGEGRPSATIIADVTRWEPGREFALASPKSADGPVFGLAVSCRDEDGGTALTCEMEIRLPGIAGRMADPVLGAVLTRQVGLLLAEVGREAVSASPGGPGVAVSSPRGRPASTKRRS